MSKGQTLRALVSERLAAAAEDMSALCERMTTEYEELRGCEEENERKPQLRDQRLNPRVLLHRVASRPALNHDFTETPPIKEEPEEQAIQEQEQLPESDPKSSAVCVKEEESSPLQSRQFEERRVKLAKEFKSEPHLHSEGLTELSDNTDTDEDWKCPLSCSETETETDADDYNQDRVRNRITVHKGDMTSPEGGEKNKLQCSICTKTFKIKRDLQKHTRVHTGEKPFRCGVCDKTFAQKQNLVSHRRTHTGEKPYSCETCKKTFAHETILRNHERTHTGERPFRCSACKQTFSQKGSLERHRRTHVGEKPFRCSVCDKTFSQKSNLESHTRTHTGERPYSCSVCDKTFARRSNMNNHRRTHTGQKPYSCSVCAQTFTEKSSVKHHMRSFHSSISSFIISNI